MPLVQVVLCHDVVAPALGTRLHVVGEAALQRQREQIELPDVDRLLRALGSEAGSRRLNRVGTSARNVAHDVGASGAAQDRRKRRINHLDLGDNPYEDDELALLTAGGQEIWADGNAGGSSIYSEIFAYEVLHRCELALLLKTETEVEYTIPDSKITDLVVEIDGVKVGVSVTRAVGWPQDAPWTTAQAVTLLEKKLESILSSSAAVAPADAWTKQILHIIAYADQHAEAIETALATEIAAETAADTIVIVTVSDGDDAFLY